MDGSELLMTKACLRAVLQSDKTFILNGLRKRYLEIEYKQVNGVLDYKKFGCSSLLKFLTEKCQDACRVVMDSRTNRDDYTVFAVSDANTRHIEDLQRKTKNKKKRSAKRTVFLPNNKTKKTGLFKPSNYPVKQRDGKPSYGKPNLGSYGKPPLKSNLKVTRSTWNVYGQYVITILQTRPKGMMSCDIQSEYEKKFRERLPSDWVDQLEQRLVHIIKDYGEEMYLLKALPMNKQENSYIGLPADTFSCRSSDKSSVSPSRLISTSPTVPTKAEAPLLTLRPVSPCNSSMPLTPTTSTSSPSRGVRTVPPSPRISVDYSDFEDDLNDVSTSSPLRGFHKGMNEEEKIPEISNGTIVLSSDSEDENSASLDEGFKNIKITVVSTGCVNEGRTIKYNLTADLPSQRQSSVLSRATTKPSCATKPFTPKKRENIFAPRSSVNLYHHPHSPLHLPLRGTTQENSIPEKKLLRSEDDYNSHNDTDCTVMDNQVCDTNDTFSLYRNKPEVLYSDEETEQRELGEGCNESAEECICDSNSSLYFCLTCANCFPRVYQLCKVHPECFSEAYLCLKCCSNNIQQLQETKY